MQLSKEQRQDFVAYLKREYVRLGTQDAYLDWFIADSINNRMEAA